MKIFIFVILFFMISMTMTQAFAERDGFWIGNIISSDPYYFSDNDFGINILKLSGSSMEPYLVPGVTDENSSIEEISKAYHESTASLRTDVNPPPTERAKIFVVSFSGGELEDIHFTSFMGFEPIQYKPSRTAPYNHQQMNHGLELSSLPEKNMKEFYQNIIASYVNAGRILEPVNITVDVVTGDGRILQSWHYNKCDLAEYTPYRDENLTVLKLSGQFAAEYADKTVFACVGHNVDFTLRESPFDVTEEIRNRNLLPTNDERVKKFAVHFSGGEIPFSGSSFSFAHYAPVTIGNDMAPQVGSFVFDSPQFLLSSLPHKDMEEYYQWIERYINIGKTPEPFDVTVDLITGDDSILQTWNYKKCQIVNYVTYWEDLLPYAKYSGGFDPEFRDRAIFQCNGVNLDASIRPIEEPDNVLTSDFIPSDHDRAQHIVVHFGGSSEISSTKSISTFTKFAPVLDDKSQPLIPTYPLTKSPYGVGTVPKFILEGLPSKDKEWLYEFTTKYVNAGKIPDKFKVSIDLVTGDGSTIQTWNYKECQITNLQQHYDDVKIVLKAHGEFGPEIYERTTFDCGGFSFDGTTKQLEEPLTEVMNYVDYAPKLEDRATKYAVHFSGGEITKPITSFTFSKFEPSFPQSLGPAKNQPYIPKLILEGLMTKERQPITLGINPYFNPERPLEPFDVTVDVLTGDNQILQQWQYKKCQFVDVKLLLVNYILIYKIHGGDDMEYRDYFEIECNGLRLDFGIQTPDYQVLDTEQYLQDPQNRLTGVVFHMQNGELESTWTSFEMPRFEAKGAKEFSITGLPNKNFFDLMEFFSRYMNPGKSPENFDVVVDLVAGDGDRILSIKYLDCKFNGGYMYLDDQIASEKIRPQISPEFKAKGEATCYGVGLNQVFAQMYTVPTNTFEDQSPLKQVQKGILRNDVTCKEGKQKMLLPFKEMPRCVFSENTHRFEERLGWNVVTELDEKFVKNPIPKLEDSADTIKVRFSGTDFDKEISVDTFVKYVPTASVDSDQPGYAFGGRPLFFLNGLPSQDKSEVYEFISKTINPGKKPNQFQVAIDILYGDGSGFMSLNHIDCKIERYHIFLDRGLFAYKYQGTWQSEIKDRLTMSCAQIGGGPTPVT